MILPNQKNGAGNFNCITNESTPGSRLNCTFILQVSCYIHMPEGDLNQIILSFRDTDWRFCNHSRAELHNLCSRIFSLLSKQYRQGRTSLKIFSIIFQLCCWNRRVWRMQTEFSKSGNNFISDTRNHPGWHWALVFSQLFFVLFSIWALIQREPRCLSESSGQSETGTINK